MVDGIAKPVENIEYGYDLGAVLYAAKPRISPAGHHHIEKKAVTLRLGGVDPAEQAIHSVNLQICLACARCEIAPRDLLSKCSQWPVSGGRPMPHETVGHR